MVTSTDAAARIGLNVCMDLSVGGCKRIRCRAETPIASGDDQPDGKESRGPVHENGLASRGGQAGVSSAAARRERLRERGILFS
jgi:hypothetical protein